MYNNRNAYSILSDKNILKYNTHRLIRSESRLSMDHLGEYEI